MEGDRGQTRTLKDGAVHVGEEVPRLHGPAERIGKHQPQVQPKTTDPLALRFLACAVTPKGRHQGWRQHHLASRCCGLWNTERKSVACPPQRATDLKHALVQVDVLPTERK